MNLVKDEKYIDDHQSNLSTTNTWRNNWRYTKYITISQIKLYNMLQLTNIERDTWTKFLIVTYLATYFVVILLKLVQTLCIFDLVVLYVWDQVLVDFMFDWDSSFELSNESNFLKRRDIRKLINVDERTSTSTKRTHLISVVSNVIFDRLNFQVITQEKKSWCQIALVLVSLIEMRAQMRYMYHQESLNCQMHRSS